MRHRLDYLTVEVDYQYGRSLVNWRSLNGCTLSNTIDHFAGVPLQVDREISIDHQKGFSPLSIIIRRIPLLSIIRRIPAVAIAMGQWLACQPHKVHGLHR